MNDMNDTMKATLPAETVSNSHNYGDKKELIGSYNVIALKNNKLHDVVTARLYMGRSNSASMVYASIWVYDTPNNRYFTGYGSAGGYGYHKGSAALAHAIESAGIKLSRSISGVGETAIKSALIAITRAAGYRGKYRIVTN